MKNNQWLEKLIQKDGMGIEFKMTMWGKFKFGSKKKTYFFATCSDLIVSLICEELTTMSDLLGICLEDRTGEFNTHEIVYSRGVGKMCDWLLCLCKSIFDEIFLWKIWKINSQKKQKKNLVVRNELTSVSKFTNGDEYNTIELIILS